MDKAHPHLQRWSGPSAIAVQPVCTQAQWDAIRTLFREYAASLNISLCFQDFERELAELPGDYAQPHGKLLLATVAGDYAGCCAFRALKEGLNNPRFRSR